MQDAVQTTKGEEPRRLARSRIANRQYKDYELYVTVEEEGIILATVGDKHDEEENDEEELAVVAYYVMTHYAEKEVIKKKKYKQKIWAVPVGGRDQVVWETRGVSSNKGTQPIQQI